MTNETELRDRIKRIVEERNAYYGGHSGRANPATIAQAIIDEFGLIVETRNIDETRWPDDHVNYSIARVVGKWERS